MRKPSGKASNFSPVYPTRCLEDIRDCNVRTAQGDCDLLIVDRSTTSLVHASEATVLRFEVERRDPIVGHILSDGAGGAG